MKKRYKTTIQSKMRKLKVFTITFCFYTQIFTLPLAHAQFVQSDGTQQINGSSFGSTGSSGGFGGLPGGGQTGLSGSPQGAQVQQFIGAIGQQFQQINQANQDSLRQQAVARQANVIRSNNIPDSDFPQCNIKPVFQRGPVNLCNSLPGGQVSPLESQIAQYWQQIARVHVEEYDRVLVQGGQKNLNFGVQCLEESRDRLLESLRDQIQLVTNEITRYQQVYEAEVERARAELIEIRDENLLLTGNDTNDVNANSERIREIYSGISACNNVLTSEDTRDTGGLYSIRDNTLEAPNDAASRYSSTTNKYANVVNEIVNNIEREVNDRGVGPLVSRTSGDSPVGLPIPDGDYVEFGSAQRVFAEINEDYQDRFESINSELSKISDDFNGFTGTPITTVESINEWDRLTSGNFNEILQKGESFFREQYARTCVSDPNSRFNVGISQEAILTNLYNDEREINKVGTSFQAYKDELARVFAVTDLTVSERINRVRQIEAKYASNNFPVYLYQTYKGFGADRPYSPSELLGFIYEDCQTLYEIKSNENNARTRSPQEVVQESLQKITELSNLENQYKDQLKSRITARVVNCEGITRDEGPGTCNDSYFNTQNPSFCFQHASACSTEIKSCLLQTNQVIGTIQQAQVVRGNAFNDRMRNLVNIQQTFLNNFVSSAIPRLDALGNQFYTGLTLPDSLNINQTIRLPATEKAYGLDLIGGLQIENDGRGSRGLAADRASINQLPDILGAWRDSLESFRDQIANETEQRINEQVGQFQSEIAYWEGKAQECTGVLTTYDQQIQQENARRQQEQQQQQEQLQDILARVQRWCANKQSLDRAPGCGERIDRLYEDSAEIAQYINPAHLAEVDGYAGVCAQYQGDPNQQGNNSNQPVGRANDVQSYCVQGNATASVSGRRLAQPFTGSVNKARNIASSGGVGDVEHFISLVEELQAMSTISCTNGDVNRAANLLDEISALQANIDNVALAEELRQVSSGSHGQAGGASSCSQVNNIGRSGFNSFGNPGQSSTTPFIGNGINISN